MGSTRSTSPGTGRVRTISLGKSEGMLSSQTEERNTPRLSTPSSPPSTYQISRSVLACNSFSRKVFLINIEILILSVTIEKPAGLVCYNYENILWSVVG